MANFDATTAQKIRAFQATGNLVGLVQTAYITIQAIAALRTPYNNIENGGSDPGDQIIHDAIALAYTSGELTELFEMAGALEDTVVGWDGTYAEVLEFTY